MQLFISVYMCLRKRCSYVYTHNHQQCAEAHRLNCRRSILRWTLFCFGCFFGGSSNFIGFQCFTGPHGIRVEAHVQSCQGVQHGKEKPAVHSIVHQHSNSYFIDDRKGEGDTQGLPRKCIPSVDIEQKKMDYKHAAQHGQQRRVGSTLHRVAQQWVDWNSIRLVLKIEMRCKD